MFVDGLDRLLQFLEHRVVADPLTGMAEGVGGSAPSCHHSAP